MATLKELKEHFRIFGKNNNDFPYIVYDKAINSGKRSVYKYLCTLKKKNSRFAIVGTNKYYSKIDDIKTAIDDYVNSLEFDSEHYNPLYKNGYTEEMIIIDYLFDRGFSLGTAYDTNISHFYLNDKDIYGGTPNIVTVSIIGLNMNGNLPDDVEVQISSKKYSWVSNKCKRDVHEIIKTIDSLLKPYFLTEGIRYVNHSDKYKEEEFKATLNKFNTQTLNTFTKDYKLELKEKLEGILETL